MKMQNIKYATAMILMLILSGTFTLAIPPDVAHALDNTRGDETIVVEDGQLSVDLRGITIKQFMNRLNEEVDLKFNVDKSLSQEKLYAQFEQVPLPQGLKKIFNGINYILYFLQDGRLSEVILLSKKEGYDANAKTPRNLSRRRSIRQNYRSRIDRARQRKYIRTQRNQQRPVGKPNSRK